MLKGLRFQKRIKIMPGVTLNISKSGIGISAGVRGAHIGINSHGQKYTNVGLPGTGISYRKVEPGQAVPLFERVWNWLKRTTTIDTWKKL